MEAKPAFESLVKGPIDRVLGPTWIVRLQSGPGCIEGFNSSSALAYTSEIRSPSSQILLKKSSLEVKKESRNPLRKLQNTAAIQYSETKGVKGPGPHILDARKAEAGDFKLEIPRGRPSERADENPLWLDSAFQQAGYSALHGERLARTRARTYSKGGAVGLGDSTSGPF